MSGDPISPYTRAWRDYSVRHPRTQSKRTLLDRISHFFIWAIEEKRPGFRPGDEIVIPYVADNIDTSRTTVGKALEILTKCGLVQARTKAPYRIVASKRMVLYPELVADASLSVTRMLPSGSIVGPTDIGGVRDQYAALFAKAIREAPDPAIRAAREPWLKIEPALFRRARVRNDRAFAFEITYLNLEHRVPTDEFMQTIEEIRSQGMTSRSLYDILEIFGVVGVMHSRTRATVDPMPAFAVKDVKAICNGQGAVWAASNATLMRWEYALFAPVTSPAHCPMVSFSVCYVDTAAVNVFIRNMDMDHDADKRTAAK